MLEQPRHLSQVVQLFYDRVMKLKTEANPVLQSPPLSSAMSQLFAEQLLVLEHKVLESIGFDCWVELPYDLIDSFQETDLDPHLLAQVKHYARFFANDSFRTEVGLCKPADEVAKVCLVLAAQHLRVPLSLDVDEETFKTVKEIYSR